MIRQPEAGLMLCQRLRRRPNTKPPSRRYSVVADICGHNRKRFSVYVALAYYTFCDIKILGLLVFPCREKNSDQSENRPQQACEWLSNILLKFRLMTQTRKLLRVPVLMSCSSGTDRHIQETARIRKPSMCKTYVHCLLPTQVFGRVGTERISFRFL